MFGMDRFSKAAQQITFRFLLEKANQHLRNLYPRYNLICAPDSFALAVEDYEMGTSRPCTTLSGGESFIVSLALALGLSSLSDEKIKVDTLFIDEGFGTLSAEYLDTVMKVLEGLQRTGRKVGIISHVEILRERIPAQIQVVRKSRTESEIKVV
jgi:exonuclease SbcC